MKTKLLLSLMLTHFFVSVFSQENSKFYKDSIYSNYLNEYRPINIYLPKNFIQDKLYPIIYATDGYTRQEDNEYKNILDSLIDNYIIPPVVFVESYTNSKVAGYVLNGYGDTSYIHYRNYEYVETWGHSSEDSTLKCRFEMHMKHFVEELIPEIEKRIGLLPNPQSRMFYGYSNGGGFGINLFLKHPDIISTYMCFSTLGSNIENLNCTKSKYISNYVYLAYGNAEPEFFKNESNNIAKKLKKSKVKCKLTIFNGGHDFPRWKDEFVNSLTHYFKQ